MEALARLGDAYLKIGQPEKAVPCYQRIYVMYGRWPEYVAKAYWQSGQAFEKLSRLPEAAATYREFLERGDLSGYDEYNVAKQRLNELGSRAEVKPLRSSA